MKQTCILILGMHRSGTSALTGVLSLLDVYLGSELMPANFSNEKGYFENNILFRENERLLAQINSSWDDIFYDKSKLDLINETKNLKEIIKKEFNYSKIFAIKDPRLAFLFPVYKKVLQDLDIDIKIILPYRNPIEVANSLQKREGMPLEKGMLLWVYHFLLAEKFSRGHERVFIGFDDLMTNTEDTIQELSSELKIDFNNKYMKKKKEIDLFLEPSLKHHNIAIENLSQNIPTIVKNILSFRTKFNKTDLTKEFDVLFEELFSCKELFYNSDIIKTLDELKQTKEILTNKDKALHVKSEELNQTKENLQTKEQELNQTKQNLQTKEQELNQKKETLANKDKALQIKNEERNQRKQALHELILQINKKDNEINILQDELALIYTGRSWKITRPLRKLKGIFKK